LLNNYLKRLKEENQGQEVELKSVKQLENDQKGKGLKKKKKLYQDLGSRSKELRLRGRGGETARV